MAIRRGVRYSQTQRSRPGIHGWSRPGRGPGHFPGRQFNLYQSATAGLWVQHLPVWDDVLAPGHSCHPGFKPGANFSPALAFEASVSAGPWQQSCLDDSSRAQQLLHVFFKPGVWYPAVCYCRAWPWLRYNSNGGQHVCRGILPLTRG